MKRLETYIREDHSFLVKSKAKNIEHKYFPTNRKELISVIEEKIKKEGNRCDLNDIDVSEITDLTGVFSSAPMLLGSALRGSFNGDIHTWDTSNVKNMQWMFYESAFNGDISQWDVGNVKNMKCMFANSQFSGDLSPWDVRKVEDMYGMFYDSKFNNDISRWNVDNILDMSRMFDGCPLQNNLPKWYKKK